jgi:flagellar biosynthesis anti-sigma factor FlgM
MRIDKNGLDAAAIDTQRTASVQGSQTSQTRRTPQDSAGDQVELSAGAALAGAANAAAEASPEVRPDVVARAKALLESGELGADPYRLADALIDRTLRKE